MLECLIVLSVAVRCIEGIHACEAGVKCNVGAAVGGSVLGSKLVLCRDDVVVVVTLGLK